MTNFYTTLLVVIITIVACKSPNKLYQQGNYNDAIEASLKKLQKDPHDPEYRDILKRSYAEAVYDQEDRIKVLSASSNDTKYAQMYGHYLQLQALYEKIRRHPAVAQYVKLTDYSGYVETYSEKAAAINVERGMKWMERDDKNSYREAYREFRAALSYKPNDIDIKRKLEEAYDYALVKILVVPIGAYSSNYHYSNSSYQMRNFQDRLMRQLNQGSRNEFVRFYTELDWRSNSTKPDEIIEMRLGRMNIGQPYDESESRQVSKEVVVKETVYKKDSVVKEYAKVFAKITSVKRTLLSEVEMYVTTREPGGRIMWSDNIRGEHRWQTEFATYTGDERALTDNDKSILNKKDRNIPEAEDIADELMRKLQVELSQRFRNYYNRYQ
ncbi:MAG TPA: hypothetical protein VM935_19655 [Chitinophagaceae bacterium]|jgi:tetratricopeptide (TPR) repeat protein|nr:hypothetical protein [Chitinophagaceae bacterium]